MRGDKGFPLQWEVTADVYYQDKLMRFNRTVEANWSTSNACSGSKYRTVGSNNDIDLRVQCIESLCDNRFNAVINYNNATTNRIDLTDSYLNKERSYIHTHLERNIDLNTYNDSEILQKLSKPIMYLNPGKWDNAMVVQGQGNITGGENIYWTVEIGTEKRTLHINPKYSEPCVFEQSLSKISQASSNNQVSTNNTNANISSSFNPFSAFTNLFSIKAHADGVITSTPNSTANSQITNDELDPYVDQVEPDFGILTEDEFNKTEWEVTPDLNSEYFKGVFSDISQSTINQIQSEVFGPLSQSCSNFDFICVAGKWGSTFGNMAWALIKFLQGVLYGLGSSFLPINPLDIVKQVFELGNSINGLMQLVSKIFKNPQMIASAIIQKFTDSIKSASINEKMETFGKFIGETFADPILNFLISIVSGGVGTGIVIVKMLKKIDQLANSIDFVRDSVQITKNFIGKTLDLGKDLKLTLIATLTGKSALKPQELISNIKRKIENLPQLAKDLEKMGLSSNKLSLIKKVGVFIVVGCSVFSNVNEVLTLTKAIPTEFIPPANVRDRPVNYNMPIPEKMEPGDTWYPEKSKISIILNYPQILKAEIDITNRLSKEGIALNSSGYMGFDKYAHIIVDVDGKPITGKPAIFEVDGLTGSNKNDFTKADAKAGITEKYRLENGLTWHHKEDGRTMILISGIVHNKGRFGSQSRGFRGIGAGPTHAGGASLIKKYIKVAQWCK
jgi:DNase/tRNase domain of colicin-like bacteriocin